MGVVAIAIPTLAAILWLPLSEYRAYIWVLAIITIGGDTITTSLFSYFEEEEQEGITRRLCGAQPSFHCMVLTRLPLVVSASVLYLAWVESGFTVGYGSETVPPELIPLMLAIGGVFAIIWNVYGFIR